MKKPVIGILTWREETRFAEPSYFRRLIRAGSELGFVVFLFSPVDTFEQKNTVRGFIPSAGGQWRSKWFPWPDVVIDRYRYKPNDAFKRYVSFRKQGSFLYANNRLANKWKVHEVLCSDERMHRWLPETRPYDTVNLREMMERFPLLYVKPVNGTGGRSIVRIQRTNAGFTITGRDKVRNKISFQVRGRQRLNTWLRSWINREKFIIQQGLHLELIPNRAVDMRLLIQKNEEGSWSITGYGIRVGGVRSATSNLHGGGKAVAARPFLRTLFSEARTEIILQDCEQLALQTAETIENHFGRMIELGLDIGIDTEGRAWLIEVNPKPGREIFKELGQLDMYRMAINRPLLYARYLWENTLPAQL